ncbi:Gfo/Idh/MocA family oxidoreductase [Enterococcus cecorum]|uniref:Gfo/Idh/MocA family protein n=1 Tax=Enterococcus cecorum TaxID=44008 RepID=UPI002ACA0F20|nr:Gfo/Idh/MocA family oxidoreductase [Enterococcus cecorum]MDZ5601011.1 Gfo/Idh/MocA family oxidoreductase [Enterococcus cecorum]
MKALMVGLGWMGKKHFKIWKSLGVEIVAVVEKCNFSINKISEQDKYHKDLSVGLNDKHVFDNVNIIYSLEELGDIDYDFVDIVTNENTHVNFAEHFLNLKKPVIIEKPIATDYDSVVRLIDLAKKNGTYIYAGHLLRFDERNIVVKENLDNSILYASFNRSFQSASLKKYGHSPSLYTSLVHDIDLLNYFFSVDESQISNISYHYISQNKYTADLVTDITFKLKNCIVNLHNDWLVSESNEFGFISSYDLRGLKKNVSVSNQPVVGIYNKERKEVPDLFYWNFAYRPSGALYLMLEHFLNCIAKGEESTIVSMNDVLITYGIVDKLLRYRRK